MYFKFESNNILFLYDPAILQSASITLGPSIPAQSSMTSESYTVRNNVIKMTAKFCQENLRLKKRELLFDETSKK